MGVHQSTVSYHLNISDRVWQASSISVDGIIVFHRLVIQDFAKSAGQSETYAGQKFFHGVWAEPV